MVLKGLWLALISQFEYPIRILAARAAVAADGDGDAWKLCCWTVAATGEDRRSSVQEWSYTREGATKEGNVHPNWNVHSKHNIDRVRTHKRTHMHFITACLYDQSVIRCARTQTHIRMSQQLVCIIWVQWGLLRIIHIIANIGWFSLDTIMEPMQQHQPSCHLEDAPRGLLCWLPLPGCLGLEMGA
eukprot:1161443-Pelagomonas_calceolata.AAC.1